MPRFAQSGLHGVLVLDKPEGLSSATAVERVKRMVGADRAGHGGTLDPIATGVLPICLGVATKLAQYLLADDKAYEAEGLLGIETDTLDRTGQVIAEQPVEVTEAALRAAIARRIGEQDQIPPAFSAIKQGGVRNYHRARAGEQVERAARRIRIDQLELIAFEPPRFRVAVACSKGTYVRSLIADLGADVGCGAHLTALRRTRSGRFSIAQAVALDQIPRLDLASHLVPLTEATDLPIIAVPEALVDPVLAGVQLSPEALGLVASEDPEPPRYQLVDGDGTLLAIAHCRVGAARGKVVYDRVFGTADKP
ncbi:MAG: tRNA pseudouridine(55) synthase TruB [Kofleriaceae bacterium]